MANNFTTNVAPAITEIRIPRCQNSAGEDIQLKPTLELANFNVIESIKDISFAPLIGSTGQGLKDILINGVRKLPSTLTNLNIRGSAIEGNFFSLPSGLTEIQLYSDDNKFTGNLPTDDIAARSMNLLEIVGNNNEFTGSGPYSGVDVPNTTNIESIRITGSKLAWSGSNFFPTRLRDKIKHYAVANEGNDALCSNTSALPSDLNSAARLFTFNGMGCKLTGDLPTSLTSTIRHFKIGGRLGIVNYHSGLSNGQAFPSFKFCNNLKTLSMSNLQYPLSSSPNSGYVAKIISCASDVFQNCTFPNNTKIFLRNNAFSGSTTNEVLVAIDNAAGSSTGTGRVIDLRFNNPPTGLTDASTGAGNTAMTSLISKGWSFLYNTSSNTSFHQRVPMQNRFLWPTT